MALNHLSKESSPYLLQHSEQPVDWYAWSDVAFEKAKKENKLIILSIGYSTCHWCHVMSHETFENPEVAIFTNKNFISIKVDREERPDIDQLYMKAVQMMTGQGGWPLNCILLPNKEPIFGGTYFTNLKWLHILKSINNAFQNETHDLEKYAHSVVEGLTEIYTYSGIPVEKINSELLESAFINWKRKFDLKHGGINGAPKFPLPNNWKWLLEFGRINHEKDALDHALFTVQSICLGGICDHIEGGFFRYSVDDHWKIPHFEKMLYDNAQMIDVLALAYRTDPNPIFKNACYNTIDWIFTFLFTSNGGIQAATDADTNGVEGDYYIWTEEEYLTLSEVEKSVFNNLFYVGNSSHWEHGKYIFFRKSNNYPDTWETLKNKFIHFRSGKERPKTDFKCITSWNAMLISGLCVAGRTFSDNQIIEKAKGIGQWIIDQQYQSGEIFHIQVNGKTHITHLLEDYAFAIKAFIDLYMSSQQIKWLTLAHTLNSAALNEFYDAHDGLFKETTHDLLVQPKEIYDNVIASSNSIMCENLIRLGVYYRNDNWIEIAEKMCSLVMESMVANVSSFSQWAINALMIKDGPTEITVLEIMGQDFSEFMGLIENDWIVSYHKELPCSLAKPKGFHICSKQQCFPVIDSFIEFKGFLTSDF